MSQRYLENTSNIKFCKSNAHFCIVAVVYNQLDNVYLPALLYFKMQYQCFWVHLTSVMSSNDYFVAAWLLFLLLLSLTAKLATCYFQTLHSYFSCLEPGNPAWQETYQCRVQVLRLLLNNWFPVTNSLLFLLHRTNKKIYCSKAVHESSPQWKLHLHAHHISKGIICLHFKWFHLRLLS